MIGQAVAEAIRPTAINCAEPAKTNRDIAKIAQGDNEVL